VLGRNAVKPFSFYNRLLPDRRNFAGATFEPREQKGIDRLKVLRFDNVIDDVLRKAPYMARNFTPSAFGSYRVADPPSSLGHSSGGWVCVMWNSILFFLVFIHCRHFSYKFLPTLNEGLFWRKFTPPTIPCFKRPVPIDNLHAAHRDDLLSAAFRKFAFPVGRERKPMFFLEASTRYFSKKSTIVDKY